MRLFIALLILLTIMFSSCSNSTSGKKVVKPRYHHSWYKDHVYKKKWRVGRIKIQPEKQGVKKVKMKG